MAPLRVPFALSTCIALLAISGNACSDATGPIVCPDSVSVSVTAGTTPTFAWQPSCLASTLIVTDVNTSSIQWAIYKLPGSLDSEPMSPPVHYGVLPPNMAGDSAKPLTAGVQYFVVLTKTDPAFGLYGRPIASAAFTP